MKILRLSKFYLYSLRAKGIIWRGEGKGVDAPDNLEKKYYIVHTP